MWNRDGDLWVTSSGHFAAQIQRKTRRRMFRWGRYTWAVCRAGCLPVLGESKSLKKAMTACESIMEYGNTRLAAQD